jgi:hypothetical protein
MRARADCKGGGEGNDKEAKYIMKKLKKEVIKSGTRKKRNAWL